MLNCPEAVGQKLKNAPPFPLPSVLLCLSYSLECVARGVRWCVGWCVCAVVIVLWSCLVMVVCVVVWCCRVHTLARLPLYIKLLRITCIM